MLVDEPVPAAVRPGTLDVALRADGLRKAYRDVVALDGLDVVVRAGTVTALLGPNGAGKTTLIETIAGLRTADAGRLDVLGLDPRTDRAALARVLGVQVQEFSLQATVKVHEALAFFARLYPDPLPVDEVLERFGLQDKATARFPRLSGGQKRRLGIARALIGNPRMVVLDEPTSGLDPQGQAFLRDEVRRLRDEGRTVLLSTHDVDDAEELADDIVVVDHGRVVAQGTPAEILRAHGGSHRLLVRLPADPEPALAVLRHETCTRRGDTVVVHTDAPDRVTDRLADVADGHDLVLDRRRTTLEDVFLHITGPELRS